MRLFLKRKEDDKRIMQNLEMCIRWMRKNRHASEKDQEITHYPMTALAIAGITARIFYLLVIDQPETENSGWLAVLIGAAFSIPPVFGGYYLMKKSNSDLKYCIQKTIGSRGFRLLCLVLSLAFAYETSSLFTILTSSGSYATLYNMHKLLLLVPTSFAVIYACTKGGNGIGGAAEAWIRIYIILYTVILCLEYDTMNFYRIFPILGPGVKPLLKSALNVMTYFLMIPVSFLLETGCSVKGKDDVKPIRPESILLVFLLCVLVCTALLMVHSSMYPSLLFNFDSRSSGMDLMLSNGRSNRTVQLPILIIWFSALSVSASFMLFCAGRLMNIALCEKGSKCTVLLGMIAMVIALFRLSGKKEILCFNSHFGVLLFSIFAFLPILYLIRNKEAKKT